MTSTSRTSGPSQIGSVLDLLTSHTSQTSVPRRALLARVSAAALAMMFAGSIEAEAAGSHRPARPLSRVGGPVVIPVGDYTITIEAVDGPGPSSIRLLVHANENPAEPIHSAVHSGTLTAGMIDLIERVADLATDLRPSHVSRFNALLLSMGLDELTIPRPVQPNQAEAGRGFLLVIVLFILLVIVGAGLGFQETE
jgi:uncharacterized protein (TIGR01732 family)